MEFGYWEETIRMWHEQGLPKDVNTDDAMERHLGLEGISIFHNVPVNNGLLPPFEHSIIEENDSCWMIRDYEGNIVQTLKNGTSMPKYVECVTLLYAT